ncbi:PDZ and LIM domain protein 5-like isoform X2 [Tubulanus polymorphus]|uniref:PDZ and LIM domain protein 5-like isoform X2 n=1 Tax=Tubulanus polymorphus TaxID=672921 RepID=UPI003DA2ADAB
MSAGMQISAKLDRTDSSTPWGFRLQGGKDFSRPLTIQRVTPGSLADKCGLKAGDVVAKISGVDTTSVFHKEAQQAVINSGNYLELVLQRGGASSYYAPDSYSYPTFSEAAQPSPYSSQAYNNPASNYSSSPASGIGSQMSNLSLNRSPQPFRSYEDTSPGYGGGAPYHPRKSPTFEQNSIKKKSPPTEAPPPVPEIPPPVPPPPSNMTNGKPGVVVSSETLKLIKQEDEGVDDKQDVTTHSRTFRLLQQQLDSGTYNPQEHPGGKRMSPILTKERSESPKSQSKFVPKQYNSPIGLYSAENAASDSVQQWKSINPSTNSETPSDTKPDGTKIYRPSETYKLVKEQESVKSPRKSPVNAKGDSPPASSPKMGRTMRHLQIQLDAQEFQPVTVQKNVYRQKDEETNNNAPQTITQTTFTSEPVRPPLPQFSTAKPYSAPKPAFASGPVKFEPVAAPLQQKSYSSFNPNTSFTSDPLKMEPLAPPLDQSASEFGLNEPGRDYNQMHVGPGGGGYHGAPTHAPPPLPQAPAPKWSPASSAPPARGPAAPGGTRGNPRFGKKGDAALRTDSATRIPVCHGCSAPIRGPFVLALGQSWCPDHFTCANCNVKLIDIGFIEIDGRLYCERDYEQYFAPHCTKCKQTIVGDCVNALSQTWHPHCFLCTHCRQPIGSGGFHMEEGLPYCEKDWAEMFQMKCNGCQFPIEPGDRWVEAIGQNFHSECFNCSACQVNLEGSAFCAKNGKPYCKKHASGRF